MYFYLPVFGVVGKEIYVINVFKYSHEITYPVKNFYSINKPTGSLFN